MSDDTPSGPRPRPPTIAGPELRGKWFRRGSSAREDEDTDVVHLPRLNTVEKHAVATWYQRLWFWLRKKFR